MAYGTLVTSGILASTTNGFAWATEAMTNLMSMVTAMIGAIKAEPVLAVYFAGGLALTAIGVLSALRHAG